MKTLSHLYNIGVIFLLSVNFLLLNFS